MLAVGVAAPHTNLDPLFQGLPTLVVFFKTTCPTCCFTFPFLERLSKGSLQLIGISQDEADRTAAFQEKLGLTFQIAFDRKEEGYPASNAFGISSVPSLFLIEPDRTISLAVSGFARPDLEFLAERAEVPVFLANERVPALKPG